MKLIAFTHVLPIETDSKEDYPEKIYINPEHVVFVKEDPDRPGHTLIRSLTGAWTVSESLDKVLFTLRFK